MGRIHQTSSRDVFIVDNTVIVAAMRRTVSPSGNYKDIRSRQGTMGPYKRKSRTLNPLHLGVCYSI